MTSQARSVPPVFPVLTAVNNSVSAVNIVKSLITDLIKLARAFKDAKNELVAIDLKVDDTQMKLQLWKDYWGLRDRTSERYQRELWGQYGVRVERQFTAIRGIFESTKDSLRPFLDGFNAQDITKFVTITAQEINNDLSRVKDLLSSLQTISANAYRAKHRIKISDWLSKKQLDQARTSVYLDLAVDARSSSNALFKSCCEANQAGNFSYIKLEIDLSRAQEGTDLDAVAECDDILIHYHFLVLWNSELADLFVEGLLPETEARNGMEQGQEGDGFIGAVTETITRRRPYNFRVPQAPQGKCFLSRTSTEQEKILSSPQTVSQMKPIKGLLYEINSPMPTGVDEYFPLGQRVALAFKVVEFGLLLAGTAWLSELKSSNVERSPMNTNRRNHFVLKTMISSSNDDWRALAQHIFQVGLLLAEIGVGQIVQPAPQAQPPGDSLSRTPYEEMEFFIRDPRTGVPRGRKNVSQLQTLISANGFGTSYAKAVVFCLEDKRDKTWKSIRNGTAEQPNQAYRAALEKYYAQVYKPIQKLAEMDLEPMPWQRSAVVLR